MIEMHVTIGQFNEGWRVGIQFETGGMLFFSHEIFPTQHDAETAMYEFTDVNGIQVIHTAVGQA